MCFNSWKTYEEEAPHINPSIMQGPIRGELPVVDEIAQSQESRPNNKETATEFETRQQGSRVGNEIHFGDFNDLLKFVQDVDAGLIPPPGLDAAAEGPSAEIREIRRIITKQFSQNESNPIFQINKAAKDGRISRRQAKQLKATLKQVQKEYLEAWAAGEDLELFTKRIQAEEDDGMNTIDAFGDGTEEPGLIGEGKWLRIRNGITMDSGSSVFVIPSGWLKMFERVESEGSKRKQTYTAAAKDGKPIINEGEKTIKFTTDDGQRKKVVCQIARVNKILASIAGICDKNNEVNFRKDGGDIVNCKTGKKTPFRRLGNIYVMDAWVLNPKYKSNEPEDAEMMSFSGQVASK